MTRAGASDAGAAWVADSDELAALAERLVAAGRYGIDTEFHRERTYYPRLALLQLASADEVALVDPLEVDVHALAPLFESEAIAVAHAVDQDLEVLESACGAVPTEVFDTQVAAGFLGMSFPSLSRLVESVLGLSLPKADRLTDWTRRPLTEEQRLYAAADVAHLLDLHDELARRLGELGRLEWAEDECAELVAGRRQPADPARAWWKMRDARSLRGRSRGVAQEVAAWRERRAARLDIPPRFVLPDIALASIAHRPPQSQRELQAVRGLERRHFSGEGGDELLAAVRQGLALAAEDLVLPPESKVDRSLRAAVTLAAAWMAQLAEQLGIEASLLATRAELEDLLAGRETR